MVLCQWFGVNMGFSDNNRILMKSVMSLKVVEQKKLLQNFQIKVGDCGDWSNFWKSCKKLASWLDEVTALKAYKISFVFYSVIFIHKLDIIRKEYAIWLQIFPAAALPNIIKIGQHWLSNHKSNKKLCYREEHSASVLLSCLVGVLYDISRETIFDG